MYSVAYKINTFLLLIDVFFYHCYILEVNQPTPFFLFINARKLFRHSGRLRHSLLSSGNNCSCLALVFQLFSLHVSVRLFEAYSLRFISVIGSIVYPLLTPMVYNTGHCRYRRTYNL